MTNEESEDAYEDMDEDGIQEWIEKFNAGYELGLEGAKGKKPPKPLKVSRVRAEPVDWDAAARVLYKEGA